MEDKEMEKKFKKPSYISHLIINTYFIQPTFETVVFFVYTKRPTKSIKNTSLLLHSKTQTYYLRFICKSLNAKKEKKTPWAILI